MYHNVQRSRFGKSREIAHLALLKTAPVARATTTAAVQPAVHPDRKYENTKVQHFRVQERKEQAIEIAPLGTNFVLPPPPPAPSFVDPPLSIHLEDNPPAARRR